MKKLSKYLILLTILSCSASHKPGIEEIVSQGNYKIECSYQGCFGGGTTLLEVKDFNKATYTEVSGSRREEKQIAWNTKKDSLVREFFKVGITFNDTIGMCTTTSSYTLSYFRDVIKFDDLNCEMNEKFSALLE